MGGSSASSSAGSSGGGLSMGAVTAGIGAGMGAISLLNSRKKNKQQQYYLQQDYLQQAQARQNLLEKQLSSRRAQLGGMGIISSGSAAAAEQRLAGETYDAIALDQQKYTRQRNELELENQENLRQGIYDTISGVTNRLIK